MVKNYFKERERERGWKERVGEGGSGGLLSYE